MLPCGGAGGNISSGRIPLDVGDTVVLVGRHKHEVAGKLLVGGDLLLLLLFALKVGIPELELEALLRVHGGNDNKASTGCPVDGVGVLLFNSLGAHPLADGTALQLLGCVKVDIRLGGNSSANNGLISSDENEAVSLGLPRKVDNNLLELNNLDGNVLLGNAEELERGVVGLLGLGVTVNLDTEVLALVLPVQLAVRDVDQVAGPHNLLAGDAHKTGSGGLVVHLGGPVTEELLGLGPALGGHGNGRLPLKVDDTLNLDGLLSEKSHLRGLVDLDGLARHDASDVLVIGRPLEAGPRDLLAGLLGTGNTGLGGIDGGKRTNNVSGLDVPDDEVLSILVGRQGESGGDDIGDDDGLVGPRNKVVLAGRVVDQVNVRVSEAADSLPVLATPKLNTLCVNRSQKRPLRRPLHKGFCPVQAVNALFRCLLLPVVEHANIVATEQDHLVTGVDVVEPRTKVLLLLERLDLGLGVLVLDAALTAKVLNVGELVDVDGVLLIERDAVESLTGGDGNIGGVELNKCIATAQSLSAFHHNTASNTRSSIPGSHAGLLVDGHEDGLGLNTPDVAQLLAQELDKLGLAVLGHAGASIDNDKGIKTLVKSDLELLPKI